MNHVPGAHVNAIIGFPGIRGQDMPPAPKQRVTLGIITNSGGRFPDLINETPCPSQNKVGKMARHDTAFEFLPLLKSFHETGRCQ